MLRATFGWPFLVMASDPPMPITTARLTLRGARQSDLDDLFAIYGHPDAMRYWSTPAHPSSDQTQGNLDWMIAQAAKNPLTYFVIERDGRVIGTAGMHKDDEIGFILHPDHWRQGIVYEAMQAIIPHLFNVTDRARLTADADPENVASVALLKKLGFIETHRAENTFCINGVWSHSVYLALPRP